MGSLRVEWNLWQIPTLHGGFPFVESVNRNRCAHSFRDAPIYLAPSQFEAGFMSAAHSESEIEITVLAAERAFKQSSV
jgi:glutamate-1-semialdehyde 2,1-aminomutase